MKKFNRIASIAILGGAALLLASCGTSKTTTSSSESKTRTVTDSLKHKVTVPTNPKRIVASYLEDYVIALGDKPVAQWTVGGGSVQNYLQDDLKGVKTINYDLPYEDVLKFEPDLLLMSSDSQVEGSKYAQYKKIAPTYVVKNGDGVTWQEQLKDVAKVLNKEDQAKTVLSDYNKLVNTTKEKYSDQIKGKSAAVIWITNNSAYMVASDKSSGRMLYSDLGFEVPSLVQEVTKKATADWSAVSLENLAKLDADYLFVANSDTDPAIFNEDIWKNIPAVKNNQMFEFDSTHSWQYNGPIANTEMIKDVQASLK
jgi:iron complex transport system substrate-binding protein